MEIVYPFIKKMHHHLVFGRRVRRIARFLAELIPDGSTVLDIGCGDGTISKLIMEQKPGVRISGLEIMAREKCHISYALFDGTKIDMPDASVDVVMFNDVLHHCDQMEALMREACRVSAKFVLIKDHQYRSQFDFKTLKLMDWVGNRPHGVQMTYGYLNGRQWAEIFGKLNLETRRRVDTLSLYAFPLHLFFDRGLHFVALLEKILPSGLSQGTR